jgi:hypothetical protein
MSKIATVVDPLVKIKKKAKIDGRESKGRFRSQEKGRDD